MGNELSNSSRSPTEQRAYESTVQSILTIADPYIEAEVRRRQELDETRTTERALAHDESSFEEACRVNRAAREKAADDEAQRLIRRAKHIKMLEEYEAAAEERRRIREASKATKTRANTAKLRPASRKTVHARPDSTSEADEAIKTSSTQANPAKLRPASGKTADARPASNQAKGQRDDNPPKLYAPPLYKARVSATADGNPTVGRGTAHVDEARLHTIKSCLDRGNHPNANKDEAKTALHLASRLMKQHNVTLADVLAGQSPEEQQLHAGESVVEIFRRDGDRTKPVQQAVYMGRLLLAMECFFDVKSYTQSSRCELKIVFYGIVDHTRSAAHACEMVYNIMVELARECPGTRCKNSFCDSLCKELRVIAEKEKTDEEARVRKAEAEGQAASGKHRTAQEQPGFDRDEQDIYDDDDEEGIDAAQEYVPADFDIDEPDLLEVLHGQAPPKPVAPLPPCSLTAVAKVVEDGDTTHQYGSLLQLYKARETWQDVANKYIKDQGKKLRAGRKRVIINPAMMWDRKGAVAAHNLPVRDFATRKIEDGEKETAGEKRKRSHD